MHPRLRLARQYVRQLSVDIVTGQLSAGVEAVEVAVAYHDATGNVHDEQTFRLGIGEPFAVAGQAAGREQARVPVDDDLDSP